MKATINGVAVEGSPQEIMEYQRMQAEKAERKPFKSPYASVDTDWMRRETTITSGDPPGSISSGGTTIKRCTGPCYCTGACEQSFQVRNNGYFDYPVFNHSKV